MFKGQKKLYFVAETKSHTDYGDLRSSEWQIIQCGYRHFEDFPEVGFKHITDLRDLETECSLLLALRLARLRETKPGR